jgi:hypothetical protein
MAGTFIMNKILEISIAKLWMSSSFTSGKKKKSKIIFFVVFIVYFCLDELRFKTHDPLWKSNTVSRQQN